MSELHDLTATEQVELLRQGATTSVELTEHYLARIERANPTLRAFTTVDAEGARARASAADAAGRPGVLRGLPIGDKDLTNRAGVATTYGSLAMAGYVPDLSDPLVTTLDGNGAVSLGKTNTPEFGFPSYCENRLPGGVARNPWDLERGPGGSSGGAAVAVAAGLLPVAPGSDGGGSIRIPAAATGLVGLKPSRGRVPDGSGLGSLAGLPVAGPLARTVQDAALLLDAMIARDAQGHVLNRFSTRAPEPPRSYHEALDATHGNRPLRIAWNMWTPWSLTYEIDFDDAAVAALDATLDVARRLGHEVVEFTPGAEPDYFEAFRAVWRGGAASLPLTEQQLELVEPLTSWLVRSGRELPVAELARGLGALAGFEQRIVAQYAEFDAVLTPAMALTPRPLGWFDAEDGERNFMQQCQYTPFTSYVNVAGLPAMSLPVTAEPLPMGVHVIGRPGDELTLLRLARDLEREFEWNRRAPAWALGESATSRR
jgi:amidase